MGLDPARRLGQEHHRQRLSDRVFFGSSAERPDEGDSGPSRSFQAPGARKRNLRSSNKRGHSCRASSSSQPAIQVDLFSSTKETRHLASYNQSEAAEQEFCQTTKVPHGDAGIYHSVSALRNVGHNLGFKRCLSAHSYPQERPAVSVFPLQTCRLPVQGTSVWPVDKSKSVHKGHQGRGGFSQEKWGDLVRIFGRLAYSIGFRAAERQRDPIRHRYSRKTRLGVKQRKVQSYAFPDRQVFGSQSRLRQRPGFPNSGENFGSEGYSQSAPLSCQSEGPTLVTTLGSGGQSGGDTSVLPTLHAAYPVLPSSTLQSMHSFSKQKGPGAERGHTFYRLVGSGASSIGRKEFSRPQTSDCLDDGRFQLGLGRNLGLQIGVGPMDSRRTVSSYQCSGTPSGPQGYRTLVPPARGQSDFTLLRQLYDGGLPQPAGGNEVNTSVSGDLGLTTHVSFEEHYDQGLSPCRDSESVSRCPLQRQVQQQRVVSEPALGGSGFSNVRPSSCGSVCIAPQLQASNVLFQVSSPCSLGDGRLSSQLGRSDTLRVPTVVPASQSSAQTSRLKSQHDSHSTLLAEAGLVPSVASDVGRPSVQFPRGSGPSVSESRPHLPSRSRVPQAGCLEIVNRRLRDQGLSQRSASFAAGARRPSTVATYDSRLEKYYQWANDNSVNPLEASLEEVCSFLVSLFDEGRQISTIKNYRSALAAVHSGFEDGSSVGNNHNVRLLLRGMFNRRPPTQRLAPSWSINEVLSSLSTQPYEPMSNAPLDALTYKTLFLVAAASARRRSEIHALSVKKGFIRFSSAGVFLLPDPAFLAKNFSESYTPGPVFLPSMSSASSVREDRLVCPVRALKWYLEKTKNLRTSEALFILPRSPYSRVSKDTISRWLVRIILPFADPGERIRAHDVRAHSSSLAWFRGVSLQDILKAAAWKSPSSFVSCYLSDVVSSDSAFGRAVLQRSTPSQDHPPLSRC